MMMMITCRLPLCLRLPARLLATPCSVDAVDDAVTANGDAVPLPAVRAIVDAVVVDAHLFTLLLRGGGALLMMMMIPVDDDDDDVSCTPVISIILLMMMMMMMMIIYIYDYSIYVYIYMYDYINVLR